MCMVTGDALYVETLIMSGLHRVWCAGGHQLPRRACIGYIGECLRM
jgi:hypothetical protein